MLDGHTILRFLKDWTLPVAIGMGATLYLLFAYVPVLEGAATILAPVVSGVLPLLMFLVLFITFCKVDFRKMRLVWWHFWVIALNLLLVGCMMAAILLLRFTGDGLVLMEALLMCVIAPGATAAAVVTQKLGGSLEQMSTFTFLSNFLTAMLVPVCFPVIERSSDITFMAAFGKILYQVVTLLLMPMLLAYIVKRFFHTLHRKIVSVRDLSFYMWGCTLMIVTGTTVKNILHAQASVALLTAIALLGLLVCVFQFAAGRFIGHFFGHKQEAGQALGQKNTALAIWMAYTYLNPLSSVGPGCYILWQNIINSIEIWHARKQQ